MKFPDVAKAADMLSNADVSVGLQTPHPEYYTEPNRLRTKVRDALAEMIRDLADRDYWDASCIDRLAERLIVARESIQWGDTHSKVYLNESPPSASNDLSANYILNKELNEIKHAGLDYEKSSEQRNFWVEKWIMDAIMVYRQHGGVDGDGYAGMMLRTFLKKMRPKDEDIEANKNYRAPGEASKYKKKYGIKSKASGKNEYKPTNRECKLHFTSGGKLRVK